MVNNFCSLENFGSGKVIALNLTSLIASNFLSFKCGIGNISQIQMSNAMVEVWICGIPVVVWVLSPSGSLGLS